MPLDHWHLGDYKHEGEAHEAENLEVHPNVRALRAPYDFVQNAGDEEEYAKSKCQFSPTVVV